MPSLIELSPEILLLIASQLRGCNDCTRCCNALRNLSAACRFFRALLVQHAFKTFTLRNTFASAEKLVAVRNSRLGEHVRTIHFKLAVFGRYPTIYESNLFPKEVEKALANGEDPSSLFPNLEELIVTSDYEVRSFFVRYQDRICTDIRYRRGRPRNLRESGEEDLQWRLLLENVYGAICRNKTITHLGLNKALTSELRTWSTEPWQKLLGRLTSFSIELNNYSPYSRINDAPICWIKHHQFQSSTPRLFLSHLAKAEAVDYNATLGNKTITCPFEEGTCLTQSPRALVAGMLPNLRFLTLNNVYMGEDFIGFCSSRSPTLESLEMYDCHSLLITSEGWSPQFAPSWSDVFSAIMDAGPRLLQNLVIEPAVPAYLGRQPPNNSSQVDRPRFWHAMALDQVVASRPRASVRVFDYGRVHDIYGGIQRPFKFIQERFLQGDDQRLFDELMSIVRRNRERIRRRPEIPSFS